ncbi:TonB-dependent receptor [bacterium]|nr:TonB-dependent receptor [bacterium]
MVNHAVKIKKGVTTPTLFTAFFYSFVKSFTEPLQGKARERKISSRQPVGNISTEWKQVCARCLFATALTVTSVVASKVQAQATNPTQHYTIEIPADNVANALNRLADQTDTVMLFPYQDAKARQANPVVGRYTLMHALAILLKNSGLVGGFSENGAISISVRDDSHFKQGREESNDMNTTTKKTLLATVIGVFAAGGMATASAENQAEQEAQQSRIDEVIVTAQKREQRLLDVPISISVVSDKDMKLLGIDNITDLSYYVPNLTVTEDSPGDQQIKIRGVSNFNGLSPLVGVYLDELPLRLTIGPQIDIPSTDIERVEVLKGPQGTLFGQGAVGGVVRLISKTPSFEGFAGDVSAKTYNTKGGDMSHEITAAANIPVLADRLAFRVAANHKDKGGWIDQFPTGGDNANDEVTSNIRIRGLFQVTDNFTINSTVIRNRSESGGSNLVNIGSIDDSKYFILAPAPEDRGSRSPSTERTYDYEVYNISASYDFGFATLLSSSTKYDIELDEGTRTAVFRFNPEFSETDLAGTLGYLRDDVHAIGQEIRLSGDTDTLNWTVGIQYADVELITTKATTGVWLNDNLDIHSLWFSGAALRTNIVTSKSVAVFSDVSYDLTDQLTVSVGARYYEDELDVNLISFDINDSDDFENLSLKGSLSYALSDQANVYFTIAEGFRSGGVNFFGADPYGPESLISYEFGGKALLFEERLSVDAAAYFSKYNDYQASETILTNTGATTTITRNPGKAELKGVELTLSVFVTEQFKLGLNGHVSEGEFTEVPESPPVFLEGDSLSGVPKYSYSVNADYNFNWSSSIEGFAHINYSRHGESTFTNRTFAPNYPDVDPVTESTAVGYLGAQIGAKWNSLTLKLFGKNLNNELREPNQGEVFDPVQRRPRSVGIEASYSF